MTSRSVSLFWLVCVAIPWTGMAQEKMTTGQALLRSSLGKLPIYFIENRGLYPDEVAYYVNGADKTLFFTREGITFRLKGKDRDWVVKLEFVGANPEVALRGADQQQAVFSYFRGPKKDWKTGLRTYSRIVYRDLWPGIDLVYWGTVDRLKYEFVVAPGADPRKVCLRYRGVTSLASTADGALRVETPEGSFEDAPPEAWQDIHGKRVPVDVEYRLDAAAPSSSVAPSKCVGKEASFSFRIGDYDKAHPLIVDPAMIVYCGYIGGKGIDHAYGISVDRSGNVYVTGDTTSTEQTFPVAVGPDLTFNSSSSYCDVFVAKVNPAGTGLVYCGYIAGVARARGIAVDAAGNAYVTGETSSWEKRFPVTVGPDLTFNGATDAFVAKVNALGTGLVYCGYIGGYSYDRGLGIAVDKAGSAYVVGEAGSNESTFPVTVGPDPTFNGGSDVFVAKVTASGTGLAYCGYLGGDNADYARGIAVDAGGNAYIAGHTYSREPTFPATMGPDLTSNGLHDAFVAKVNAAGTGLVYCGFIGGNGFDMAYSIAVDRAGNAYVSGETSSTEKTFPVKVGPGRIYNGGARDAFVAKVDTSGRSLVYCGYVGGSSYEYATGIAVDGVGNAYVTGSTSSTEQTFPVTGGPDSTHNGGSQSWEDGFVVKVNTAGTKLVYCGYIGGGGDDRGEDIAVDGRGNAYVTGVTHSSEQTFPVAVGPDLSCNDNGLAGDAFVARVSAQDLVLGGSGRIGSTVTLWLRTRAPAGLRYQIGSALGAGPIPLGISSIDLSADGLFVVSVGNFWPSVFSGYRGVLDSQGEARAEIRIPQVRSLIGVRIYTAFVILDLKAPRGIRSIADTQMFTITASD